ncbi:MAG TPA: NnrS family protein [Casimicrobiaceae bacterium]
MLKIEDTRSTPAVAPAGFALWNLGFRPFYLLASVYAAISVALWACEYAGYLPTAYLRNPLWHGHEMLFGYTIAVIAGFLFTAVRNWTNRPTPTGAALAAFALLWLAGRVLVLAPYPIAAAIANAAFPVAVAIGIAIPLVSSGNRRNYFFIGLLLAVGALELALHLSQAGSLRWPAIASLQVGLDVVLFIIAVMGGRVIPMFTNNAIPSAQAVRKPWLERLALGGVLALLAADFVSAPGGILAALAALVAIAHGARFYLWHPWRTLAKPLVWVLHASYAWIVLYLALRAFAAIGLVAEALTLHALTIGAIGGMTIGMMTRTARGHTGRPLVADGFEVTCYVLVQVAAVTRVFGGMLLPEAYVATVIASALCWSAAFGLYAIRYWPVLSRPRLDGKPG